MAVTDLFTFWPQSKFKNILQMGKHYRFYATSDISFSNFIVSWLTCNSNGHILRTPCQDYGNFSIIITGYALAGHTIVTLEGLTVKECETACIQKQACRSINTKDLKCKLVSKSTENQFDDVKLTAKPNWTYRTTAYNEINVSIHSDENVSAEVLQEKT